MLIYLVLPESTCLLGIGMKYLFVRWSQEVLICKEASGSTCLICAVRKHMFACSVRKYFFDMFYK